MHRRKFRITFEPSGREVEVVEGTTILDAAHSIELSLDHVCGGACACATCHVFVKSGFELLDPRSDEEAEMLTSARSQKANSRLACQTEVLTDLIVEIPA